MVTDIVFVPGMFCVGDVVYKDLVEALSTAFPSIAMHIVNNPSVDAMNTKIDLEPNGLQADINAVNTKIKALVDGGKSVLVVAHSYGGTPALHACEGMWKKQAAEGEGGVVKVALLSSSLTLPGATVAGVREAWRAENGQINDESNVPMEQHGKDMFIIPHGFVHFWMGDIADKDALMAGIKPSPLSTVIAPVPEADVTKWDIAYLATTELDPAMPEAFQSFLVDQARASGAKVTLDKIKSGHFLQISHKDEVASWISGLLG